MELVNGVTTYKLTCKNCGAGLESNSGSSTQTCEYCGTENKIIVAAADRPHTISGYDINYLDITGNALRVDVKVQVCPGCNITQFYNSTISLCGVCDTDLSDIKAVVQKHIKPAKVVPFNIDKETAVETIKVLLANLGGLQTPEFSKIYNNIRPYYMPAFHFDAKIEIKNKQTETGMLKLQSQAIEGTFKNHALATKIFDKRILNQINNWDVNYATAFTENAVKGIGIGTANIGVTAAFVSTKEQLDPQLRQFAQDNSINPEYAATELTNIDFNLLLLPVWICSARHNNQLFHFVVNGQNGSKEGIFPTVLRKDNSILYIVIAFIILVAAIAWSKI